MRQYSYGTLFTDDQLVIGVTHNKNDLNDGKKPKQKDMKRPYLFILVDKENLLSNMLIINSEQISKCKTSIHI